MRTPSVHAHPHDMRQPGADAVHDGDDPTDQVLAVVRGIASSRTVAS